MRMLPFKMLTLSLLLATSSVFAQGAAEDAGAPIGHARLHKIASFKHQVTGVTVAADGRIFVNFPRWTEDAPVSVALVDGDGEVQPYPDAQWNNWRNAKKDQMSPGDHWVCVQSVVADKRGGLWVLDTGAPAQSAVIPGAAKLVRIDLASNRVSQTIPFDATIALQGSYLNDVRFSPDGHTAYITDSGARGALVVVDLQAGKSRRVLDNDPSTQSDKSVTVSVDGVPLRRPDGRGVEFSADGVALSADGAYLYWQAVKGKTLYRIPTQSLLDASLSPQKVAAKVETVGINGPADGLEFDGNGRLFVSSPEDHAIKVREGAALRTLLRDPHMRWPDTFALGPNGTMYVTDSRIPDMSWFKPGSPNALPTRLYAIEQKP